MAIGLLVSNLILVAFIFFRPPGHPPHKEPREVIIEKLNFNETQIAEYDVLIGVHQNDVRENEKEIIRRKNELYGTLASTAKGNYSDSLMNELGKLQSAMEQIHYSHFKDIRDLCTDAQMPAFDELTGELASLFKFPMKPERK